MSFDEKLICAVQRNPILYQKNSGGYKNISIKCRILNSIAKELLQTDETCEKRWKSLRDRYTRESKKLLLPSGSGAVGSQPSDWEHWEVLGILKDHIKPRNSRDNFAVQEELLPSPCSSAQEEQIETECNEIESVFENDEPVRGKRTISLSTNDENSFDSEHGSFRTLTPVKKLKSNEVLNSKLVDTMDAFKNHLMKNNTPTPAAEETANSAFMKSATIVLSSLQPINQIKARRDIMQYLCAIQLKEMDN